MPVTPRPLAVTLQVVSIVLFTFIGYLNIGIPLAVLPGFVHDTLGFGAVVAGLVISVQYLATLLSRPYASRLIDNQGCKRAVMYGLAGCGLSGVFMLLAAWLQATPWMSLTSLLVGRLVLGSAESLVGSGAIGWGIGRVGAQHTAKVISWNGIASYGALAIGAPLGVVLVQQLGLWSMGVSILLLCAAGLALAWPKQAAPIVSGVRMPFLHVLGRVFGHGSGQPDQPSGRLPCRHCLPERGDDRPVAAVAGPQRRTGTGRCGTERLRLFAGIPGAGGRGGQSGAGSQPRCRGGGLLTVHRPVAGYHWPTGGGRGGRFRLCLDLSVCGNRRLVRPAAQPLPVPPGTTEPGTPHASVVDLAAPGLDRTALAL